MECTGCGTRNQDWVTKCICCGRALSEAGRPSESGVTTKPSIAVVPSQRGDSGDSAKAPTTAVPSHRRSGVCDICGSNITAISNAYALYSEAKLVFGTVGNVLTCNACCDKIAVGLSQGRDVVGMVNLFGGDATEGMVAYGVVSKCRSMGLTSADARRVGRELAVEVELDQDKGSTKALRYWYGL